MKSFLCPALMLLASLARAEAADTPTFNLMVENDSFIHDDRHYTNGVYGSWTSATEAKTGLGDVAEHLMLPGEGAWRHGYFFGQSIFTPENLSAFNPPVTDRPYAGWLFGGMRLYRDSGDVLDKVEATLGVTGPISLGGNFQKWVHATAILGGIHPEGWHYQLHDEPGLVLSEQRIWRVSLTDGPLQAELLPQANISLGNIFTYAAAGGVLRIGSNLKADWGPPRIAPALEGADFQAVDDFSWYVFAGAEGRAVARNIFLDGNSFESSRSVSKKTLVSDVTAGVALLFPRFRVFASYVHRSAEFKTQPNDDQFLSFTVSFVP